MSLKYRILQLSAFSVAATSLFGMPKNKEFSDFKDSNTTVAPANLPENSQITPTEKNSPKSSPEKIVNTVQINTEKSQPIHHAQPALEATKSTTFQRDPNKKMTKDEVEQFMRTDEYKNWRDKLGERWLLGMSGSVSEGFCPWGYMCSKGVLTIGHGIAATNGMDFSKFPLYFEDGTKMTEDQVKQYFTQVKKREPKTSNAKQVAHSVIIDGKPTKVAGMKYKDSLSIALTEVRSVIDTIYQRAYNEKGIDFMNEPYAVQILATDIGYQVGPDNFVSKWKNFLKAVKNKQYSKLTAQVSTKERADGKRNNRRHKSKILLAKLSEAQAKGNQVQSNNIINELYAVGANIYNLKFRAVHNPHTPNIKLKKREVGGFPKEVQRMFNIDKDGKPIVTAVPKKQKSKARSGNKNRKNNANLQRRRKGGGR
ncbi:MAG: hypothetical protein J6V11_00165 [Alphaproteobacteria bacterium]|nr:hypothetical protein [Alphaproteobacteria bacterium]